MAITAPYLSDPSANAGKVLVVDDSPTMRRMVTASLKGLSGFTIEEAASGLEAIERIALGSPSLLILDLNMPDMHGLELLEFLRKHQAYCRTPVIVLTTRDDASSREAAMAAGANAYMTKPFSPKALEVQAQTLLDSARETAAQELTLG